VFRFLAVLASTPICAGAAYAGPSSFQRSCNDIRIERPAGAVSLGATCRDRSGRTHPAEFDLNGYHNIDGQLVFDGRGQSSFQRSCDQIDVRVTSERVMLVAECKTRNQQLRRTTIEIQDIQNIDGRLVRTAASAPPPRAAAPAAQPASGGEEPFGQMIGSWRFTQSPHRSNVFCRAYNGDNIIGRFGDGRYRLSVLFNGPKGMFEGANLEIGGQNEPITVNADGRRLYLEVGDDEIGRIVRANGYRWRAWNREGSVSFDRSVGAAVARLRECTKVNGGR
jgi:hypothetical protein